MKDNMEFQTIKRLEAGKKFAVERGQLKALKKMLELIDELKEEAKQKHKEHFDNETIMEVGYHSKTWKVPKWLLSATREGVLEELKTIINGDLL